jgi:hypothetical protein
MKQRLPFIFYPYVCGLCGRLDPELFNVPTPVWHHYIEPAEREKAICEPCWDWLTNAIDAKAYATEYGDAVPLWSPEFYRRYPDLLMRRLHDLIIEGIASFGHEPLKAGQVADRILPEARQLGSGVPDDVLHPWLRKQVVRVLQAQQPSVAEMETILRQAEAIGATDDDKIGDVLKRL